MVWGALGSHWTGSLTTRPELNVQAGNMVTRSTSSHNILKKTMSNVHPIGWERWRSAVAVANTAATRPPPVIRQKPQRGLFPPTPQELRRQFPGEDSFPGGGGSRNRVRAKYFLTNSGIIFFKKMALRVRPVLVPSPAKKPSNSPNVIALTRLQVSILNLGHTGAMQQLTSYLKMQKKTQKPP